MMEKEKLEKIKISLKRWIRIIFLSIAGMLVFGTAGLKFMDWFSSEIGKLLQ